MKDLRKYLQIQLKALNAESVSVFIRNIYGNISDMRLRKIDMWCLHGPDRSTPYEVTFKAVNDLHKEG